MFLYMPCNKDKNTIRATYVLDISWPQKSKREKHVAIFTYTFTNKKLLVRQGENQESPSIFVITVGISAYFWKKGLFVRYSSLMEVIEHTYL